MNILEAYSLLSTAGVSDALDRLAIPGSASGLMPLQAGQRMIGQAFTVRYVPVGKSPGTVGDYIDDVEPGQVVVIENQGRTDCTVWGDILTSVAHSRGVAGTVISGVCRDVAKATELEYPIYSLGRFMQTGKDRVEVADENTVVSLGRAQVAPGDLVLGDDDGVVIVPRGSEEKVLEVAREIADAEERIVRDAIEMGSLSASRTRHGYHALQRSGADGAES